MENGAVVQVDSRTLAIGDSEPRTGAAPDISTAASWVVQLALNNNYNNDYNSDDDDTDDDSVLTGVLSQVHHAYVLPPPSSAHGRPKYSIRFYISALVIVKGAVSPFP